MKITTTNRKEAKKTGKEYLGKEFYKEMDKLKNPKISRCKYCKDILPKALFYSFKPYYKLGYCSEWCWDMENPPEIKRVCKFIKEDGEECGLVTLPCLRKDGRRSGMYYKYCEEHIRKSKIKKYEI